MNPESRGEAGCAPRAAGPEGGAGPASAGLPGATPGRQVGREHARGAAPGPCPPRPAPRAPPARTAGPTAPPARAQDCRPVGVAGGAALLRVRRAPPPAPRGRRPGYPSAPHPAPRRARVAHGGAGRGAAVVGSRLAPRRLFLFLFSRQARAGLPRGALPTCRPLRTGRGGDGRTPAALGPPRWASLPPGRDVPAAPVLRAETRAQSPPGPARGRGGRGPTCRPPRGPRPERGGLGSPGRRAVTCGVGAGVSPRSGRSGGLWPCLLYPVVIDESLQNVLYSTCASIHLAGHR